MDWPTSLAATASTSPNSRRVPFKRAGPSRELSPVRVIAEGVGAVWAALMHRWSALNERQRALLGRIAEGEDPGGWAPGEWRSAYALRDGGLLTVRRGEDEAHLQVTEAGTFYLQNGHHSDHPMSRRRATEEASAGKAATGPVPYSESPVARARRAKATKLIERIVAEGRVIVSDPDEHEVTEWRRVINCAKRHGLETQGKRIEETSYGPPRTGDVPGCHEERPVTRLQPADRLDRRAEVVHRPVDRVADHGDQLRLGRVDRLHDLLGEPGPQDRAHEARADVPSGACGVWTSLGPASILHDGPSTGSADRFRF